MPKKWFIAGIGTGIGKTTVSAVLKEALKADYWKPIQSGDLDASDSKIIQSLTGAEGYIYPEQYRLELAASPHKSARRQDIEIQLSKFFLPDTSNHLLVEGAGGLYVPLNEKDLIIDLISHLDLAVVLVAKDYLGCINHTLLSLRALQSRQLPIALFVFNGDFDEDTHRVICNHLPEDVPKVYIPQINKLTKENIKKIGADILQSI